MHHVSLVLLGFLLLVVGCSKPEPENLPPLFLVQGKILSNGTATSGGRVEVRNPSDPNAPMMSAEVGKDGTFSLSTVRTGKTFPGIPQGTYEVTYLSSTDGQMMKIVKMKSPLVVKPEENTLEFDIVKSKQ